MRPFDDRYQRARQRAVDALTAVARAWQQAAEAPPGLVVLAGDPKELAVEFRRCLQAEPEVVGCGIPSTWIQMVYPLFCQARGVISPPPYKDFAKELASLMTRARRDFRGRRDVRRNRQGNATCTLYWVPDPAAAVVELAEEKRKRA